MRCTIIAGGKIRASSQAPVDVSQSDLIIGADGGAANALTWQIVPHVVIGDMDSLPPGIRGELEAQHCRFVEHPRAKDETDLELALTYAVEQGAQDITVLGALGNRLDHTLANILLLALPQLRSVNVRIVDGQQEVVLVRAGETALLQGQPGDLVSLLPLLGDARGVTTQGLVWALDDETLRFGFSRGVSNELESTTAKVALDHGLLLVIHSPVPVD